MVGIIIIGSPNKIAENKIDEQEVRQAIIKNKLYQYLESKDSPLKDHIDTLLKQKHWKLLVAISHIESQFCKRKIAFNCWGIGGDHAYRKYNGYDEAIIDANNLIESWQERGRWLTIEDMNGHYVVPFNPTWERVVNQTLKDMDLITEEPML